MMVRHHGMWLLLGLLSVASAGCCCVPGGPGMGAAGGCGPCGAGPLASLASCRGACGEVYVDEWVSEPPVPDNCGYDCGGCGRCGNCRPVRNLLCLLWGRPYRSNCCTDLCGPSCDGGHQGYVGEGYVDEGYYDDGYVAAHSGTGCNCGKSHSAPAYGVPSHMTPLPGETLQRMPGSQQGAPLEVSPEAVPTPAPNIAPTAARRLNPATQRRR
ncbi:MAG: hypothetical protein KDA45_10350 [Planctomycetales bacterium]|nr:hypothetical protein [Planctomycetales bacterium]